MTQLFHSIKELQKSVQPGTKIVATMGFFDGVHLGHRSLIESTKSMAFQLGAKSMIITLDRHPLSVLRPDLPHPPLLSSLKRKTQLLLESGADYLLILPFTKEMSQESSSDFIQPLIESGLIGMMLGYDNRFGKKLPGETIDVFDDGLRQLGLDIRRITELKVNGTLVSSSAIRERLANRELMSLEELLGRPYSFLGIVREGRQIGRTINYPTANIKPLDEHIAMPAPGIYVSEVRVGDKVYPAMAYYGNCPTISDPNPEMSLEAFLFGFSGDLYREELEIAFRSFLREDIRFDSLQELAEQLQKDEAATLKYFETHTLKLMNPAK